MIAPGMLPSPPIMMTTNAMMPGIVPIYGVNGDNIPNMVPDAAARAAPIPKLII